MLKINNLSAWYNNIKLFEKINVKIDHWIIWIYWPSWSGKTTLLKSIWWYIKPYNGEIFFENKNIRDNILQYRKQNWFHFQNLNLLDLDIKSNLDLPFLINKTHKDNEWEKYLLHHFEIRKLKNKKIKQTSWWEKERISIIKTFIQKPKIVFLDEIWASLDDILKERTFNFVKEYAKNNIVFLISHYNETEDFFNFKKKIYDNNFKILCY